MARLFEYDGRTFPDPDPRLAVDDVRRQMADFFPELANADTREERRGEDTVYAFARRIGTKGGGRQRPRPRDVVAILRRVLACELRVFDLAAACCSRTARWTRMRQAGARQSCRSPKRRRRRTRAPPRKVPTPSVAFRWDEPRSTCGRAAEPGAQAAPRSARSERDRPSARRDER